MGLLYFGLLLRFYEKVVYSCFFFVFFLNFFKRFRGDCGVLNGGFFMLNFVFSSIMSVYGLV